MKIGIARLASCALAIGMILPTPFSGAQIVGSLTIENTCSYFGERLPESVTTFASDGEAEDVIRRIVLSSGLSPNFKIQAAGVPNAAAIIHEGERYILYNQRFIYETNQHTGSNWAAVSIMAHEVGHHLNGHTLGEGGSRPELELEADSYSGFILQRMGASLEQASQALQQLAGAEGSSTHPPRHDRIAALTNGWLGSCETDARCQQAGGSVKACDALLGSWVWFTGGIVTFSGDQSAHWSETRGGPPSVTARWRCDPGSGDVTVTWQHGYIDSLQLNADGTAISGTNQAGLRISGHR